MFEKMTTSILQGMKENCNNQIVTHQKELLKLGRLIQRVEWELETRTLEQFFETYGITFSPGDKVLITQAFVDSRRGIKHFMKIHDELIKEGFWMNLDREYWSFWNPRRTRTSITSVL